MGTAHEFIEDKESVAEQDEKFSAGDVGPQLDEAEVDKLTWIHIQVVKFQAALTIAVAEFEAETGQRIGQVQIMRTSNKLTGWTSQENREKYYASNPSAKKVLDGRVDVVEVHLVEEKEDE